MRILNLYAGIGGNRKLWGEEHEVTAVEYNDEIAGIYQELYPNDKVVVSDAHQYLLDHYSEYDFIWASPPCPSHSRINTDGRNAARYPDMKLYQEIIMLGNNWYKGKWVVENVIPYYKPLIEPKVIIDRHMFWSNFFIYDIKTEFDALPIKYQTGAKERYGFSLVGKKIKHDKRQILRNLVNPEIGLHILNCAIGEKEDIQLELL